MMEHNFWGDVKIELLIMHQLLDIKFCSERNPKNTSYENLICLFVFYSISTFVCHLMPNPFLCKWTVLFQTIQFCISTVSMSKIGQFQTIQFSISMHFSSIWPIDKTLSGTTTRGHSGPKSDGNEGVLHIPQRSSITGTSLSDCLVLYSGHSLAGSYSSAAVQSVYSTPLHCHRSRVLMGPYRSNRTKQHNYAKLNCLK